MLMSQEGGRDIKLIFSALKGRTKITSFNVKTSMKSFLLYWGGFFLALTIAGPILAAPVLDQYFDPSSAHDTEASVCRAYSSQTFTAGVSGSLSQVDLFLGGAGATTGNILLEIRPTNGVVPLEDNTNILACIEVQANSLFSDSWQFRWVSFDLSSFNIDVSPNEVLALVLHSDLPDEGNFQDSTVAYWGGIVDEGVPGKEAYSRLPNSEWALVRGFKFVPDGPYSGHLVEAGPPCLGFRTYVQPVPEPSTLVMLFAALAGFIIYAMRKTH
jgi:hypothetical protein